MSGRRILIALLGQLGALAAAIGAFFLCLSTYWAIHRGERLELMDRSLGLICLTIAGLSFLLILSASLRRSAAARELHWQTIGMGADDTMWRGSRSRALNWLLGLLGALVAAALLFALLYLLILAVKALWGWSGWMLPLAAGGIVAGLLPFVLIMAIGEAVRANAAIWRLMAAFPLLGSALIAALILFIPASPPGLLAVCVFLSMMMIGLLPLAVTLDLDRAGFFAEPKHETKQPAALERGASP